jgi:hypothetical protein
LELLGFSNEGKEWVSLSISQGGWQRRIAVDYSPVRPSRDNRPRLLRARLGERGSIAMRFQPNREIPGGGKCDDSIGWAGALVGRLRFRGQQRWVDVRETRLPTTLVKDPERHCRSAKRPRGAVLVSCSRDGSSFLATHAPNGELGYDASSAPVERRGLYVRSRISLTDAGGEFSFSPDLTEATVRPPEPFAGEATFEGRRLHSGLSYEPLHGPRVDITDGRAGMEELRRNNTGYLVLCLAVPSAGRRTPGPAPLAPFPTGLP